MSARDGRRGVGHPGADAVVPRPDERIDGVPGVQRAELGPFDRHRLAAPAPQAARGLLGALLVRDEGDAGCTIARIVETEAYREDDPASHSSAGRTDRTEPMFREPGTGYVYRSYGIHWCLNVTVEPVDVGAAVLLRAAVVLHGAARVRTRRPTTPASGPLLRGPGNLAAGLDVDARRHDRSDLIAGGGGLRLCDDGWTPPAERVVAGARVGVTRAAEVAWRFHLDGVAAVSAYRRSRRAPVAPLRAS